MRGTIAALLVSAVGVAGLAATSALADDSTGLNWAQGPSLADAAKVYPTKAAAAGIAGAVKMRCTAEASGALQSCSVIEEQPSGQGFGDAALSLAGDMLLKPTDLGGHAVAGRSFIVPMNFDPAILSGQTIITSPDWALVPSGSQLAHFSPSAAQLEPGRVLVHCEVSNRGLMQNCSVRSEEPSGVGFGGAALAITALFVMKPMTENGEPVGGGSVTIPIRFASAAMGATYRLPDIELNTLRTAPWAATPSNDDLATAFPKAAEGEVASAHVVLRCGLTDQGALRSCTTVGEEPEGRGFGEAARSLIKDFRAKVDPKVDNLAFLQVDIPFDFRDPTQAAPRVEVDDPIWLQLLSPSAKARLFPDAAAKAGVVTGTVGLNCTGKADGGLQDCFVTSEEPKGLGFGLAGVEAAMVMKANPWTMQGEPIDGARVRFSLTFTPTAPAPYAPDNKSH